MGPRVCGLSMPRAAEPAPVALSIGGSVLRTGDHDPEYLAELAGLLRRLAIDRPLLVTVGGGPLARDYIDLGRKLGLTDVELDEIGIEVTRLHARLLAATVGKPATAHPPTTIAEAVREAHRGHLVIMGGTEPGHTTDAVAALLAARLRAERLVNATSVAGLYDRDPATDPTAHRIDRIGWDAFRERVAAVGKGRPGQSFVFDSLGAELLSRARIPLWIVNGRELSQVEAAVLGREIDGTRVE
jgi:uridylate kinase